MIILGKYKLWTERNPCFEDISSFFYSVLLKFPRILCSLRVSQNNVKSRLWRHLSPTSWSRHRLKSGTVPQMLLPTDCRSGCRPLLFFSYLFSLQSICVTKVQMIFRVSLYTCLTQSEGTQKQSAQTIAMWLPPLLPLAEAIISEIWKITKL